MKKILILPANESIKRSILSYFNNNHPVEFVVSYSGFDWRHDIIYYFIVAKKFLYFKLQRIGFVEHGNRKFVPYILFDTDIRLKNFEICEKELRITYALNIESAIS